MWKNILDLNDNCLSCILKYLPVDNHINFLNVCQRFRDVWLKNKKLIYKDLELGDTTVEGFERELLILHEISGYVKHLILNFNRHFVWNRVWLREVINVLKTMTGLEYITIWIKESEVEDSFELFLRTLRKLPNIKGIAAYEDVPLVENVCHFNNYDLLLFVPQLIPTDSILQTKPFELYTKIRLLAFDKASTYQTMMNLVRHATSIKELSFWMNMNAEEYIPLMQLPKLDSVRIFVNGLFKNYGSLLPLLTAMSPQLCSLTLHIGRRIKYIETQEIANISNLQYLECDFAEPQCLQLLARLYELRKLVITLPSASKLLNMDKIVLNVLLHCRKLELLVLPTSNFSEDFIPEAYKQLIKVRNPFDQDPLVLESDIKALPVDEDMPRYLIVK